MNVVWGLKNEVGVRFENAVNLGEIQGVAIPDSITAPHLDSYDGFVSLPKGIHPVDLMKKGQSINLWYYDPADEKDKVIPASKWSSSAHNFLDSWF